MQQQQAAPQLFRGPGPPWCIGSVFAAPNLKPVPQAIPIGPLLFDRLGEPEKLLTLGCRLKALDDPFIRPDQQLRNVNSDASAIYCPKELLDTCFQEDFAQKFAMVHESNQILGSRLECLRCNDGLIQLVFPIGENVNSIGSILCQQDESGNWCPLKKDPPDEDNSSWLDGVRLAASPSLDRPVFQIAALQRNADEALLAARTSYQVHVFNTQIESSRITFDKKCSARYNNAVSHVTWNPHFGQELSALSDTGELCVYDLQSGKFDLRRTLECPNFTLNDHKPLSSQPKPGDKKRVRDPSFSEAVQIQCEKQKATWWQSEYGWHPRTHMVANGAEISLFDLRSSERVQLALAANANNFCRHRQAGGGAFGALARSEHDLYHFATATREHVFLFDVRRHQVPVLQWEHQMHKEIPGCLKMVPLSYLRPDEHVSSSGGRVLLATSYRSGDIRAFCYGPDAVSAIVSSSSSRFRDIEESYSAWQLPSKMFSAFAESDATNTFPSYTTLLKSSKNDLWDLKGLERLSGVALLPAEGKKKSFSLIQLSGMGDIWNQKYRAAQSLENGASKTINMAPCGVKGKKIRCKYSEMPALWNYFRPGFVWPQEDSDSDSRLRQKKQKTEDTATTELIHEVLTDVDTPLCVSELAFKVLQTGMEDSLKDQVAGMPANVKGQLLNVPRPPYLLPTLKMFEQKDLAARLPLPFLLEARNKLGGGNAEFRSQSQRSGHRQFADTCDLVEETLSGLEVMQKEPVISLSEGTSSQAAVQQLAERLHFHTKSSTTTGSSSSRFQKFVGCKPETATATAPVKLQFKADQDDDVDYDAVAGLQQKWQKWQASFEPSKLA